MVGVGQTSLAEQINDAFSTTNQMIAQWARKRWLIFQLLDVAKVSTGAVSYTVGSGGDFNISTRPDRLETGNFVRYLNTQVPNQVDAPLRLIQSREDYNRIRMKQLGTVPSYVFYDPGWPTGTLYPWPVPQASIYEVHILVKQVLAQFGSVSDTINLPPEYEAAIRWNLADRLPASYDVPPKEKIQDLAKDALATIRGSNVAIATLAMPSTLAYPGGAYNAQTDDYGGMS